MKLNTAFNVTVRKNNVVAAAFSIENHRLLPQSNLDLLLPPVDVGVFFCYKKPPPEEHYHNFESMVTSLKEALSEILVTYYPFSGEMVRNLATGEAELFCNNGGVMFTEAVADIELQQLDLYNPDECIEGKLVPKKIHGVLAVQVTELKCGGIVIGCAFDHRVADAYSANMFLVSWAETVQSKPLSMHPSFFQHVFSPRHPGFYDHSIIHDMYMPLLIPPPSQDACLSDETKPFHIKAPINRIYHIKRDQILQLQLLANVGKSVSKRSKLEAFAAFVWKMVVKKNTWNGKKCSRLGVIVDGRSRLCGHNETQENPMYSYFGNVLSFPFGEKSIDELNDMPLNYIANEVHKIINKAASEEHFLDLVDCVEAHRPYPLVSRIHVERNDDYDGNDESTIMVSSGLRFPVRKMDFGWGKPVFGSYHFPWGGQVGQVMPMPSASGNGDWIVYMHLQEEEIATLEENASHVFKPFNFNYIED